jgi:hypothetical protein
MKHDPLLESISAAARRLSEFVPQNCSSLAWAFATLSVHDEPLFAALASASISSIEEFQGQHIAMLVWSYAKIQFYNPPLLKALASSARARIQE